MMVVGLCRNRCERNNCGGDDDCSGHDTLLEFKPQPRGCRRAWCAGDALSCGCRVKICRSHSAVQAVQIGRQGSWFRSAVNAGGSCEHMSTAAPGALSERIVRLSKQRGASRPVVVRRGRVFRNSLHGLGGCLHQEIRLSTRIPRGLPEAGRSAPRGVAELRAVLRGRVADDAAHPGGSRAGQAHGEAIGS